MKAINIDAYQGYFHAGGVVKGCDLQGLNEAGLSEMGIVDELHRQIIMECLDELIKGSSSLVRTQNCRFNQRVFLTVIHRKGPMIIKGSSSLPWW